MPVEMKHTLVVHSMHGKSKLRMDFIGKNARPEAWGLLCELQHKYGNEVGYIESVPMHKQYKTGDQALAEAKQWIEQ